MPFVKGQPKIAGRKKGTPNKSTTEMRQALTDLAARNIDNVERWLTRVSKRDPDKAIELLLKLNEYVMPKLRSVEVSGPGGKPLESVQTIKREIVDAAVAPEKKDETP